MSEIQKKANLWKQLKALYTENNLKQRVQYKKSNSYLIQKELEYVKKNLSKLSKKKREVTVKNGNRVQMYRQLKELNPNSTLKYKTSTISQIQKEIMNFIKTRNQSLNEQFKTTNLQKFLSKPVEGASYTASASEFLKNLKHFKPQASGNFLLEMYFKTGETDNVKVLKNAKEAMDILEKINSGFDISQLETYGSDTEDILELVRYGGEVVLTWFNRENYQKTHTGAYFKWFHILNKLDLSKYQVYTKYQKIDYEACLVYSLIQAGVSEDKINQLRLNVFEKEVSFRNLDKVSKQLDIQIRLTYHDEKTGKRKERTYNKESTNIINLAVVDEHYFINELTNITSSAIRYYYETSSTPFYPSIAHMKERRKKPTQAKESEYLTSYQVIRNLYNQRDKWLKPITIENINNYEHVEKLMDYETLRAPLTAKDPRFNEYKDYSASSEKTIFKGFFKKDDPNNNFDLIFLDLETFQGEYGYHQPYCLSYQFAHKEGRYYFYGLNAVKEFLDSLQKHSVIITHNLAFDFRGFVDHLNDFQSPIEAGTKLKHIQCKYGFKHLVFKDNCSFLPFKLSALPRMFHLESGDKDIYPYTLISEVNFSSFLHIKDVNNHLKKEDQSAFRQNCIKVGALKNNVVDIQKYTVHYCNQDVSILKQAYLKFREQIQTITNIDILTLISLPQLADEYFKSVGVYDDCYSISGVAQDFIRKCAIGGRVMTCKNEKWSINANNDSTKKISDFDAVSLYPSAMKRLEGYLKGLPQVLDELDILLLEGDETLFDYYFVEIEILSVGVKRDFPLISIKNKAGVRDFTNELVGHKFHLDKTTLEDLVKFQKITYRVIKGYKFTDGFNDTIVHVIQSMFEERLKLKAQNNPLQNAYKLILNASYGKLIQKPIKKTKKFLSGSYDRFSKYVIKNSNIIESYQKINENLILMSMKKSIIQHYTACHLACQVLSMSKRIMNEVMCLAEDNEIKIFYQDTDSMHLFDKDVKPLGELFKKKYNRELIGEAMGQFHTDFSVEDSERDKSYSITAVESLFLAKKTYIDKLEYKTKLGEIKHEYHIRAKGVPVKVIKELDDNYMNTYQRLFNGEVLEFDLAAACPLQMSKDYRARNTVKFMRKMSCQSPVKNIIN